MPLSGEDQTLSARLLTLPATEHAILLNRFKFLDLVQRVAAADVAEMVQTIGLEALSYKGALEKIPPTFAVAADATKPAFAEKPTRRGKLSPPRKGARAANVPTETPPRRHRFQTREKELQFINRMSQPQKDRVLPEFYLRKPPRDQQEERLMYARMDSSYSPLLGAYNATAATPPIHLKKNKRRHEQSDNDDDDDNNDDDDNVVISSSGDRLVSGGEPPKVRLVAQTPTRGGRPPPQPSPHRLVERPPKEPKHSDTYPEVKKRTSTSGAEGVSVAGDREGPFHVNATKNAPTQYEEAPQAKQKQQPLHSDAWQNPHMEVMTPRTIQNLAMRHRGHFAPKAKPKAAAEVPRVPMEVIRHASALLTGRSVASSPYPSGPQDPQQPAVIPTHSVSWDAQSPQFPSATSQFQPPNSSVHRGNRKGDSDSQLGQTTPWTTSITLSDEVLAELTFTVDSMLRDHRAVLDSIMKDREDPLPQVQELSKDTGKEVHGVSVDNSGGNVSGITQKVRGKRAKLDITPDDEESARILQQAHDALEDISDDEDELLLVSRLQRQLGAMDRELEAIEQRDKQQQQQYGSIKGEKEDLEDGDDDEQLIHRKESPKGDRRHVRIDDSKKTVSGGDFNFGRGNCRRRRRGEMPRAIVERLRSSQKEHQEYIRYTEKQWNSSHVTEQVFAQRLTETLVEDAFQEVLQEVGSILDTYVEGLVLHELQ
ncbi:Basal body protein [Trypanosoma cruzi]|nr:Basal body protein [Trypanosoma cruzi]